MNTVPVITSPPCNIADSFFCTSSCICPRSMH